MPTPLYVLKPNNGASPMPPLHIAHANGFPPGVYAEFAAALGNVYHIIALAARPLWQPAPDPSTMPSWHTLATDLIAGLEEHHLGPVIGIGHSMGGVATMLASIQRPDLFKSIVLIDPVIIPRRILRFYSVVKRLPITVESPLTRSALRRRRQWQNRQEAFDRFRRYPLFKKWSDAAIWSYIEGLTQPTEIGSEAITLRYSPEWEAQIYETIPLDIWRFVPRITVPALVICGQDTDTFMASSVRLWRRLRPDIEVAVIPHAGHLLPIEVPEAAARKTREFLDGQESLATKASTIEIR